MLQQLAQCGKDKNYTQLFYIFHRQQPPVNSSSFYCNVLRRFFPVLLLRFGSPFGEMGIDVESPDGLTNRLIYNLDSL